MSKNAYSLNELSSYLKAELKGDPDCVIHSIAPLDKAQAGQISFLGDSHYQKFLTSTQASAVILSPKDAEHCQRNLLIMQNPYLGYAKVATLFQQKPMITPGIHPSAVIGQRCQISPEAHIGAHCVIGDNVSIGERTIVHPGCTVGDDSSIGMDCIIWSNVTIYHNVQIGDRVIIQGGAVLGSDGFGMVNDNGTWYKIPQLGGVSIARDVEIGANTTIDRGALEDTIIEEGVKLDNQIQIAHNVRVGAHSVIAGCTAIAGSTRIGKHCMIAGAVSINGHIEIADGVILTATSSVSSSIHQSGVYSSGTPVQLNQEWRKNVVRFFQLDDMARRLRKLERTTA